MSMVRRWLHRIFLPRFTPDDLSAVGRYLDAPTWTDLVRELRSNSALLLRADVGEAVLEAARAETDETRQSRLLERWALLQAAAELGIEAALTQVSGGDEFVPVDWLDQLRQATYLTGAFLYENDLKALDQAITLFRSAAGDARLPEIPRSWRRYLWMVASSAADLAYDVWNRSEDMAAAVDWAGRAVENSHPDAPDYAPLLASQSNEVIRRYLALGAESDLEWAVELVELAAAIMDRAEPSAHPLILNNLSAALTLRFLRHGDPADLDRALVTAERAAHLVDRADWIDYGRFRATWATALLYQAVLRDELRELDRAVEVLNEALTVVPAHTMESANLSQLLAGMLAARGVALRRPADTMAGAQLLAQTLTRFPPEARLVPILEMNSLALLIHAADPDNPAVMRTAVARYDDLTARNRDPLLEATLRFGRAEALSRLAQAADPSEMDLRTAAEAWMHVLTMPALTPGQRVGATAMLAWTLSRSTDPARRADARRRFHALGDLIREERGGANVALPIVTSWAAQAIAQKFWGDAVEAYVIGRDLLARVIGAEPFRDYQQAWLRMCPALATAAAYAQARLGRLAEAAKAAEDGRARMLTSAVFAEPTAVRSAERAGKTEPVARYRAAAARYRRLTADVLGVLPGSIEIDPHQQRARLLVEATAEVEAALRNLSDTGDVDELPVMKPEPDQTLVYVVVTKAGGVSLLVRPVAHSQPSIQVLWHDELTTDSLADAYLDYQDGYTFRRADPGGWRVALNRTARWLNKVVMADVVTAVESGSVLTVIPSGLLGLMPLHAAISANQTTSALDQVRIRYAPNARILSVRRPPLSTPHDSLLVVDALDGDMSTQLQLDATLHVTGVHGPAAVAPHVMDNLRTHTAVHFACHGMLDPIDVRRSRLMLNEGTELTVASIATIDRAPSLVVAAACESGLHAAHLPDETIGFPAAFLELGASGVIASQWAVPKAATAELMRHFYARWRAANGIHPADALRSAQRHLRDEGYSDPTEWAGFIYIGA